MDTNDVGSMLSSAIWPEFVLPYYERFFQGLTTGKRAAHIEDLRPEHLHLLEHMGLSDFDPGISHKIKRTARRNARRVAGSPPLHERCGSSRKKIWISRSLSVFLFLRSQFLYKSGGHPPHSTIDIKQIFTIG